MTVGPGGCAEPHRQENGHLSARAGAGTGVWDEGRGGRRRLLPGGPDGGTSTCTSPVTSAPIRAGQQSARRAPWTIHIHHGKQAGIRCAPASRCGGCSMSTTGALRETVAGLGGPANGFFRGRMASTIVGRLRGSWAIFCLANSLADLRERLGRMVVGLHGGSQTYPGAGCESARRA